MLASTQDPVTPPSLLLLPARTSRAGNTQAAAAGVRCRRRVVTRHEAVSVDGERIPYVHVGPPETDRRGAGAHDRLWRLRRLAPCPPTASPSGKLWLERGGTTVVANIRGGGEFGTRWHEAGRLEGKRAQPRRFRRRRRRPRAARRDPPGRIAAEGGSNGGLLIANMLTRYPERFGALFCTIPLIDMRRYSRCWPARAGSPNMATPTSRRIGRSCGTSVRLSRRRARADLSADPARHHPSRRSRASRPRPQDGRQAAGAWATTQHFYEPAAGGHGYGKDNAEIAGFAALGMTFLRRAIGWQDDADG